MAETVSHTLGITRDELDLAVQPLAARLDVLETAAGDRSGDDFVTAGEFRLFKWLGTFALAAVLGGFGLLYEQVGDVRVAMERLQTDLLKEIHALRGEMHTEFASVRQEMHAEFASIREDISGVRERVARVETHMQRGSANDE